MGELEPEQGDFWIAFDAIKTPGHPFFKKLNEVLAKHAFDARVGALCRPHDATRGGHRFLQGGISGC